MYLIQTVFRGRGCDCASAAEGSVLRRGAVAAGGGYWASPAGRDGAVCKRMAVRNAVAAGGEGEGRRCRTECEKVCVVAWERWSPDASD